MRTMRTISPAPLPPKRREGIAARRTTDLVGARIDDVSLHTPAVPGNRRVICAAITLPRALPADVVVEVTLEDAAGRPVNGQPRRRMWSEHACDHDRFIFVARVEERDIASARRLTVTVSPGRLHGQDTSSPVGATVPVN